MLANSERSGHSDRATLQSDDLFRITIPRNPRFSPDGRSIVYIQERPDIMTDRIVRGLHVAECDGSQQRGFEMPGDVLLACWSGNDSLIAVVAAVASPESACVLRVSRTDAQAAIVGHLPACPSEIAVSRDGTRLALMMTVRSASHKIALPRQPDGADWAPRARYIDRTLWRIDGVGEIDGVDQLFIMDLIDGTLEQRTAMLASPPLFAAGLAWSTDDAQIYFTSNMDDDWERKQWNCQIYALDVVSDRIERLTSDAGSSFDPKPCPKGEWIAYRAFEDLGQFHHAPTLRIMRCDGSEQCVIADIEQNIGAHEWDADGNGLAFSFVRDGAQHLARVTLDGTIAEFMHGVGAAGPFDVEPYLAGAAEFDVTSNGVVAIVATNTDPGQLLFEACGETPRALTQLNADWLPGFSLGAVQRLDYPAPDGTPIQAWLIYPPKYDPKTLHPLILNIHGGPNLAYGENFAFRFQRYAAEGYLVLLVNYRGSAGADMRFYEDRSTFPDREFDDLMAGVEAAMDHAAIDPDRLFVTGLSAGGALTAWTIGKTTRFAAAAVHSPIINWLSHTLTNDLYASYTDRSFAAMPWNDPMAYWQRSPLSLVADVATPALIIHGEADSRTPQSEGIQLYHALKILGVPTAMVLLPEAFHIPTRPTQWIEEQQFILEWFAKYSARSADSNETTIPTPSCRKRNSAEA